MSSPGDVNVFQWNRTWFFSRRVKFDSWFNVMAVNAVSWHGPKIVIASPASGNESWGCASGDPSDSLRKSWWLSPRIGWFRINVDFFSAWSPPDGFTVPSATGKMNSSPLSSNITSFALSLLTWISDASISSSSSRSATCMSPFQILPVYNAKPRKIAGSTFFPNWWIRDWSFVEIKWHSTKEPNGMIGPFNGSPKRRSVSSRQTSDLEYFAAGSNIPWNPPTNFHPGLTATIPHTSLP